MTITTKTISLFSLVAALALPLTAFAGDFNGDGYDDLLVSAPRLDVDGMTYSGGAGWLLGAGSGLSADDFWTPSAEDHQLAGFAVASGDFNCDGTLDMALGAPAANSAATESGRVYLHISDGAGFVDSNIDMGAFGVSPAEDDHFGRALAAADFDGDGCDDLAIGRPRGDSLPGITRVGAVNMLHGDDLGPVVWTSLRPRVEDASDNMRYGFQLSSGDFNGDGIADLVIGAPTHQEEGVKVGAVHIRRLDIDTPFYDPDKYWAQVHPCEGQACVGADEMWFGWSTSVGDYDGDGTDDLAVGAPGTSGTTIIGSVHTFSNDGSSLSPAHVSDMNQAGDRYGFALASADFDQDGLCDLVAGAPLSTPTNGPNEAGQARLLYKGLPLGMPGGMRETLSPEDYESPTADKQRFGISVTFGYFTGGQLDLAVGAQRAKDDGIRSGGVYTYVNDNGVLSASQKLGLSDFGVALNQGAHFGGALAQ